jgi:hypothetical protein
VGSVRQLFTLGGQGLRRKPSPHPAGEAVRHTSVGRAELDAIGCPVSAAMVRAKIEAQASLRQDRELLATFGIDLDEVYRRVLGAMSMRLDDPSLWRLRRSRVRPLRITLSGPTAEIVLDESGRKVIEVAQWASRRGRRTLVDREDLLWACSPTPPANRCVSSAAATLIFAGSGQTCSAGTEQPEPRLPHTARLLTGFQPRNVSTPSAGVLHGFWIHASCRSA